jgi:hypothetical protein
VIREEIEPDTGRESDDALEVLKRVATADLATLRTNRAWLAIELLTIGYIPRINRLASLARDGYCANDRDTWAVYHHWLQRYGRELRPPATPELVGALLQALVEGAGIRQLVDPLTLGAMDSTEAGSADHGYALGVAALLAVFTCPSDGSDHLQRR